MGLKENRRLATVLKGFERYLIRASTLYPRGFNVGYVDNVDEDISTQVLRRIHVTIQRRLVNVESTWN